MTCVAWDGRTLAADKRGTWGGLSRRVTKIFRVDDCLVGIAGNLGEGYDMVDWVRSGRSAEKFPATQRDEKLWVPTIVIHPDRTIRLYERSPSAVVIEDPYTAIGSGRDFALAAMHLGRPAREAVEIACVFQSDCGDGVDVLELVTA